MTLAFVTATMYCDGCLAVTGKGQVAFNTSFAGAHVQSAPKGWRLAPRPSMTGGFVGERIVLCPNCASQVDGDQHTTEHFEQPFEPLGTKPKKLKPAR